MNKNTTEFRDACVATNSVEELISAKESGPDAADMATWHLTSKEWKAAINSAIFELL